MFFQRNYTKEHFVPNCDQDNSVLYIRDKSLK